MSRISKIDSMLIIFFLSAFRLPVLFSDPLNNIFNLLFVSFFALVILLRLHRLIVIRSINKKYFLLVLVFLIWGQISYLRASINGHMDFSSALIAIFWQWLILLLGLVFISSLENKYELKALLNSLIIGAAIYILLNLILSIFGVQPHDYEPTHNYTQVSLILGIIGLDGLILFPPLGSSLKGIAGMCLFVAIASSAFFGKFNLENDKHLPNKLFVLISIFFIFVIDSRMALMAFTFTYIMAIFFNKRMILASAKLLIIFSPLLPIAFVLLAGFLQDLNILSFLSRNAWDNIATLSNRTYIWEEAANVALNINHNTLIGYGINGHIESGINESTGYIFDNRIDNKNHTVHNVVIQMFIDRGIIGLLLFQAVLYFLINRLSKAGNLGLRIVISVFALMLLGQTESLLNVAPIDLLSLFLFLITISSSSLLDQRPNNI
jgi:O-antigen ligase